MAKPVVWGLGEHIVVIGDTGTGKTFLMSRILAYRQFVVMLRTKSDDTEKEFRGYRKSKTHKAMITGRTVRDDGPERILVHPEYSRQSFEGYMTLETAWVQKGWTVALDEYWMAERLGLQKPVERLLTQGRGEKISCVLGMQRPVQVSRFAISQCTHVFAFRMENRDAKTLSEATTDEMRNINTDLEPYEFSYFNRRLRYAGRGYAQSLDTILLPHTGKIPAQKA